MFKVGDTVRRVRSKNYDIDLVEVGVGDCGRVTGFDTESNKVRVKFPQCSCLNTPSNLKKTKEEKMKYEAYDNSLLEAGDRVVLTGNHYSDGESNPRIGTEWECEGVVGTTAPGRGYVSWDNGRQNGYLVEKQQLSLVKKHVAPVYKTTAKAPTIEALLKAAGSCKEARAHVDRYVKTFGIFPVNEVDIISFLKTSKTTNRLDWAIEHGFVEKVAEEVFYKRGDKFKLHNTYYALNRAGARGCDIGLVNMDTGCRFSNSFDVQNLNKITRTEFNLMCGNAIGGFKPVKLIFVENPE